MSQNNLQLVFKSADLNLIINTCIDLIRYRLKEKGINVEYNNKASQYEMFYYLNI